MAIPKIEGSQRDFSAGELDVSMKRSDDNPIMKAGTRQMSNWRIKNSRSVVNRPGRTALFLASGRVDELSMSPGNIFYLNFSNGRLSVYNAAGARVFTSTKLGDGSTNIPWTNATARSVVWDVYQLSIYIAYADGAPANVPQVLTWDGVSQTSTWTLTTFAEALNGNQKRTPFYRISPQGITLTPSALTGSITLTASAPVFTTGHVGTRVRFVTRQLLITAFTSTTVVTATVQETLNLTVRLTAVVPGDPSQQFNIGDVVLGDVSGARGIVTSTTALTVDVQLMTGINFASATNENVVGPSGSIREVGASLITVSSGGITVWDDEVMNAYRGYPSSVSVDQGRLIFSNFPAVRNGIAWSAIGALTDFYVGSTPAEAIFELAPGKSQVLYVMAGPESSEFIFCDNGVYYIPITSTNPLVPGSVAFNLLSKDGCAAVQPRVVQELLLYINVGLTSVLGIVAPGAYYRPYEVKNLSELHAHLLNSPVAIAVPSTTMQFEERYAYVLNSDGTVAVGKYNIESGQIKGVVGWLPWSGVGTVNWLSAFGSDVIFSTSYAPNGIAAVSVIEKLDNTQYLDSAVSVNAGPTALQQAQPAGTNIGNMTGDGGLAAAVNGTRVQNKAASATLAAADGYVGRHFTTPQVIGQALVWPSSDSGFAIGGAGNITIELRAKAAAPSSSTDGVLLATATLTADQTTGPVILNPTYDTTTYAYAFIHIAQGGATSVICAQYLLQSGALWWLAGGTADLMDNLTRMMGTYTIDASGNIVPQNNAGENLSSTQLVAGQPWTAILEPFVPDAQPGQSVGQRMFKRRVSRMAVYVINSTGFLLARLFSGPLTRTSPALGTIMNTRRISTWNQDDDPTLPPPFREEVQRWRPIGRAFDPRVAVIKDTPGPLEIPEIGLEATI